MANERVAPEIFTLGDHDKARVLVTRPSREHEPLIEDAATLCPSSDHVLTCDLR